MNKTCCYHVLEYAKKNRRKKFTYHEALAALQADGQLYSRPAIYHALQTLAVKGDLVRSERKGLGRGKGSASLTFSFNSKKLRP